MPMDVEEFKRKRRFVGNLRDGGCFLIPNLTKDGEPIILGMKETRGQKVSGNESATKVRFKRDGETGVETSFWAPGTEVVPIPHEELFVAPETVDLVCPQCGKECTSKSGLTLHIQACRGKPEPGSAGGKLVCEHCGKACSSTSGLTLHKKHAHPEIS